MVFVAIIPINDLLLNTFLRKRNTEKFARERGINEIDLETLYAAKEAVGA